MIKSNNKSLAPPAILFSQNALFYISQIACGMATPTALNIFPHTP
ncbi:MAG: hypothetical protein RBR51_10780 [Candidatus Cloacimonadaceae bacterium]|nr:hypothetical protein [Candidatus Cloacimonadaceae bacterium]